MTEHVSVTGTESVSRHSTVTTVTENVSVTGTQSVSCHSRVTTVTEKVYKVFVTGTRIWKPSHSAVTAVPGTSDRKHVPVCV